MSKVIPILLYHSVADDVSTAFKRWSITPETFAAHVAYLHESGYHPITVSDLIQAMAKGGEGLPARPVVLTFDDGLADFYTGAWPALRAHKFVATLYITTGFVGCTSRWLAALGEGQRPMLTWEQVEEICRDGVECGAHSHTHPQLDVIPLEVARKEIARSKATLEDHLGREVSTFAYPFGYNSASVRQLVQEAGYTSACAVKNAMSTLSDERFALSRIIMTHEMDVAALKWLLLGQAWDIAPAQERLETKTWRLVRRVSQKWRNPVQRRAWLWC